MTARGRYLRLPAERLPWRIAVPVIGGLCLSCWSVFIAAGWLILRMFGAV